MFKCEDEGDVKYKWQVQYLFLKEFLDVRFEVMLLNAFRLDDQTIMQLAQPLQYAGQLIKCSVAVGVVTSWQSYTHMKHSPHWGLLDPSFWRSPQNVCLHQFQSQPCGNLPNIWQHNMAERAGDELDQAENAFRSSVQPETAQFQANPPLNEELMSSFLLEQSRALPNTRSRQHSNRWYEFTRSSPIMQKLPLITQTKTKCL